MGQTVGIDGEHCLAFNRLIWRIAIEIALCGVRKSIIESALMRIKDQAKVLVTFVKEACVKHKTDDLTDNEATHRSINACRSRGREYQCRGEW